MSAVIWRQNRVYVNDNDMVGRIDEASVEIKRLFTEVSGMGMPAKAKVPNGKFDQMTAKLKINNLAPGDIPRMVNADGYLLIKMRGDVHLPNVLTGKIADDGYTSRLGGWVENIPLPAINNEHKTELEVTINVMLIEVSTAQAGVVFLIDNVNGITIPPTLN